MDYKYKKNQIFGKRLKLPKEVLQKIYNSNLSFDDFIKYDLADKIPMSCLQLADRKIVEKFGLEKAKHLDWELLNKSYYDLDENMKELLMTINPIEEDLNIALYEIVKDKIKPSDYSQEMKILYRDRLFDMIEDDNLFSLKINFNRGELTLQEMINSWNIIKDKDLSYCLMHDRKNIYHITDSKLKDFMNRTGKLYNLVAKYDDIYSFINSYETLENDDLKQQYLNQFANSILDKTIDKYPYQKGISLSNDEYKELLNYVPIEDYLRKVSPSIEARMVAKELETLSTNYIFDSDIPFDMLKNPDVLKFVGLYGVKNVIDFDNECGHFFTRNNCEMLKVMNSKYLQYAGNERDPNKTLLLKGRGILASYSKEDFDEVMRRIIRYGITDNSTNIGQNYQLITGEFRANNPGLFIDKNAPQELQEAFYQRKINANFIFSHPNYWEWLKNVDLELLYSDMPIKTNDGSIINLVSAIKNTFKEDSFNVMVLYGKYLEEAYKINYLQDYKYVPNASKDDLLDGINFAILQAINTGRMKYDENFPSHFKINNPQLFLPDDVPKEIRDKFYNKELTIDDFRANPNLLHMFEKTNILYGFKDDMLWISSIFKDSKNIADNNYMALKIIDAYLKIDSIGLQNFFKKYIKENIDKIDLDKLECASEILTRLSLSNSSEMSSFSVILANQILSSPNPIETLNKIEEIFIKNNLPTVGKIYSCFELLHPNMAGFDFYDSSMVSPVLKQKSNLGRQTVIFSDLIKASFGSNNRSVNAYLKNIEVGNNLYESIKEGRVRYDDLTKEEQQELVTFSKHLLTLYNNTVMGKKEQGEFEITNDVIFNITELAKRLSPNGTVDYNLADRVVSMFCHFADIDTLDEAKSYINLKVNAANMRNRKAAQSDMVLEPGDFIKGIGTIDWLGNILQNGSLAKEYLGASATSDTTPLDTDLSRISDKGGNFQQIVDDLQASWYGPIFLVLKGDDRFTITRTKDNSAETKGDSSKLEAFYTGLDEEGHYGIRTGFASSEINYIVMKNYDPRVGLELAMNGFYIPIANAEGKIVFTPLDYDKLRAKMSGMSYYGEDNYIFSDNLVTEDTDFIVTQLQNNNSEVESKKEKLNSIIKKSLDELGLHLKTSIDGDLSEGYVELIDIGSTGRGTNKPGDGDFDFMMRLDNSIISNPSKLEALKSTLLKNMGKESSKEITGAGDFRLKDIKLDDTTNIDLDITFTKKTDKISYSTDMALQDRLSTIKKNDPEKYNYVVANIILAKQVLKQNEVYKPSRSENKEGGLGGVGIENWILQNGGSFIDAAKSFVEASRGKTFEEFKESYPIWNFGENHLAERKGEYAHNNFVSDNMDASGYDKMRNALMGYLNTLDYTQNNSNHKK